MQTLFYGFIGKNEEVVKEDKEDKEDFEILCCPETQMINQIHRKIKLLNEFKNYIENTNNDTIYYNYIVNTVIYESDSDSDQIILYTILPGIFSNLYEYRLSNSDDFFRMMAFLEL